MEESEGIIRDPKDYYQELQTMYLDESEINLSNDFEARASLVKLKRLKSDFLGLKREISSDMRSIRNMYLDESILEKPKILGIFSFQKKLNPTEKRKKLITEREKSLIPYKEIVEMVDDYVNQIEDLEKYIKNEALETYSLPKYTKVSKGK
jgi:hypothetical protein